MKRMISITDDFITGTGGTLCVTFGMATQQQKEELAQKQIGDVGLNECYLLDSDVYELWANKALIGYCAIEYSKRHNVIIINMVYLLPDYRGKGVGDDFATVIAKDLTRQIFQNNWANKKKKTPFTVHADFESEEGERFFYQIFEQLTDEVVTHASNLMPDKCFSFIDDAGF